MSNSPIICPGIHPHHLTENFLSNLSVIQNPQSKIQNPKSKIEPIIFPTHIYPAYSSWHLSDFLKTNLGTPQEAPPLLLIAFSAGVVAAVGAAWWWQQQGGRIAALIALDGWGVPLWTGFPCYRLSHDYFTHWSSSLLGAGRENFYAEPAVEHLQLWTSPQNVSGWWVSSPGLRSRCSAQEFIAMVCQHEYKENLKIF